MKRLFVLFLALVLVLSLAACGGGGDKKAPSNDDKTPGSSGQQEQNTPDPNEGEDEPDNSAGNISISTASIDGYDLPEAALAYVGTFNKAYNDLYNDGEITFYVKSTKADDDAFDALVDYYASNGGILDEGASTSTTKCFDFSWGRIEAAHFGADEEISAYIILPEYPIADNGGEEDNSAPDEPDNSGNNAESNEGDTWTAESFLKLYGFDAEELKPNHFTSFEELKMADSKQPGKKDSMGSVTINVEKGKTTADDFNAWFEALYAKMTELSDDGKLYYSVAKTVEATPLSELQSGVLWADMPGGLCVITTKVDGSDMTIGISSKYDVELEQYSISITVM